MERLHPIDDGQVIREIVPGGDEPREFVLYPSDRSVIWAQRFENSRFMPKFLVALVDDGMPVDGSCLDDLSTDEFEQVSDEMLHSTINGWRENEEEFHNAA